MRAAFLRTLHDVGGPEPSSWSAHPDTDRQQEQAVVHSLSVAVQQAAQYFLPRESMVVETFGHIAGGQAHFELKVRAVPTMAQPRGPM